MVAFYRTCFQLLPVLLSLINSMVLKLECRDSDWWRCQFNLFVDNASWWWLLPYSSPSGLHCNFFRLAPIYWSAWLEARSWLHITDLFESVTPLAMSEQISKKKRTLWRGRCGNKEWFGQCSNKMHIYACVIFCKSKYFYSLGEGRLQMGLTMAAFKTPTSHFCPSTFSLPPSLQVSRKILNEIS